MNTEEDFKQLVEKINKLKEEGKVDLSSEEDLSLAVMNLVSLEEHFYFTAQKTEKKEYFDLLGQVREVRKKLLAKLVPEHEGETWCISKHLLAASMRLIEVGTKYHTEGKKQEAQDIFDEAYKIYALFWAIRLKLVDLAGVKKVNEGQLNVHEGPWTAKTIVDKLVDCCNE